MMTSLEPIPASDLSLDHWTPRTFGRPLFQVTPKLLVQDVTRAKTTRSPQQDRCQVRSSLVREVATMRKIWGCYSFVPLILDQDGKLFGSE